MAVLFRTGFLVTLVLVMAACGGSGGGDGATVPDNDSACDEPGCDPEVQPPPAPLLCGGFVGATCPQGYHCVDDTADNCDAATGADCNGICILGTDLPSCGGFGGTPCQEGYLCTDDPDDACDGGPAVDCPGICTPDTQRECAVSDDCPQLDALCSFCADGKISCPLTRCDGGKCVIAVSACPSAPSCGGINGSACDIGFECVDDPSDLCDSGSGHADCTGVCVPAMEPTVCGGFGGLICPPGFACVDDPNDDCRPDASGADCPGICEPPNGECETDGDCPQLRAPCSECPNGTTACPSSKCDNGVCNVSFPTCQPPVTCGDDAQPCKPEHVCVDDPDDRCDPSIGDVACPGLCVPKETPRACGGSADDACPPGYECFYDTADGCMPNPSGTDCGGICQPINTPECHSDAECPHLLAPCTECPDGSFACPVGLCRDGKCDAAFESCPNPGFCGGIAGFPCPLGLTCIDNPKDDCDPQNGGADCGGVCVREERPASCGGFTGEGCPDGYECADVAGDDCDPNAGGADCPGICRPLEPPACGADSVCPVIGAPCLLCPDGTTACPQSFCKDGQCYAVFERCSDEN